MGPKSCAHDGPLAELACSRCLLQPCWLSCASAGDSTGGVVPQIVSVCTTTCRSRVFWQSLLSFKTQHIRAKPGRRCVGRPASEARPGGHTPRPKAEHGCADPPSPPHFLSEIAAHASLSSHRNGETVTFQDDRSFFTVFFTETFWHFPSWSFPPTRLSPPLRLRFP